MGPNLGSKQTPFFSVMGPNLGSEKGEDIDISSKSFRVCWWNGGGAIRIRINVNPGFDSLLKTSPDIIVYGESACSHPRGLFLSGYRFLFHRSYIKDKEKPRRGLVIFYKDNYHNLISKAYSSKTFDIVWIKLSTKKKKLYFCFFYAPGAHCLEDVRIRFYKILSDSYMKFVKKGDIYFLGDANARLGTFTNDLNIHGSPVTNKKKPLFIGFTEYCGLTLLNNIFEKGTPTYEIPNLKRSIIDMGLTNSLPTVSNFKVLALNMGVSPQTCHKVLELSIKLTFDPITDRIPPYQIYNRPGNRHDEYLSSILCKFLDLSQIFSPYHYHGIQNLFSDAKNQILGYYKRFDRKKRNSQEIQNLQSMFKVSLDLMSAEKTALSVMRAKLCEKALYNFLPSKGIRDIVHGWKNWKIRIILNVLDCYFPK